MSARRSLHPFGGVGLARRSAAVSAGTLERVSAFGLATFAGAALVVQNGINTNLRKHCLASPFAAGALSFAVGTLLLIGLCVGEIMTGVARCDGASLRRAPWYAYLGGVLGTIYVTSAILLVEPLGFATFQLCATLGQLLSSVCVDAIGLLLLPRRAPTRWRIAAVFALAGAAALTLEKVEARGEWYVLLGTCAGAAGAGSIFPVQACVNKVLKSHLKTPLRATLVSFAVGMCLLVVITSIVRSTEGPITDDDPFIAARRGEWWMWTGGSCGVAVVSGFVIGVPRLGAAAYTAIFIAAQLATALVFDAIGAFGFDPIAPTGRRVGGVLLGVGAAVAVQLEPRARAAAQAAGAAIYRI